MNNDQSNGNSKRLTARVVAGLMGLIYSVGVVTFVWDTGPTMEILTTIVAPNFVGLVFWILGLIIKKPGFMWISVIFWGVSMYFFIIVAIGDKSTTVFCIAVLFLIFYFATIMVCLIHNRSIQNDLDENSQLRVLKEKNSTLFWRCAAISAAFFLMAPVNFVALAKSLSSGLEDDFEYIEITVWLMIFILNLMFTISWWYSVNSRPTKYTFYNILPILWWGLIFGLLWIIWIDTLMTGEKLLTFLAIIGYFLGVASIMYSIAVISLISIIRVNRKQSSANIKKSDYGIFTKDPDETHQTSSHISDGKLTHDLK